MERLKRPIYQEEEQEVEHEEHNVGEVLWNAYTLNDFQSFHHIRSLLMWNGMKVLISDVLQLSYLAKCYLSRDNTALLLVECNTSHVLDGHRCCTKQSEKEEQERANYKNCSNSCDSNCEVVVVEIPLCTSTRFTASCTSANSFSVQFKAPANYNNRCQADDVGKFTDYRIEENGVTVEELTIQIVDDQIDFDTSKCIKLLQQLSSTTKQERAFAQNKSCHTLQSQCTNEEKITRARHVDPVAYAMKITPEPISLRVSENNKTTICNLTSGLLSMLNEYNEILSSMCANIHAQQSKVRQMQREILHDINTEENADHVSLGDESDRQGESLERQTILKPHEEASNINEITNKHTCGWEYVNVNDNEAQLQEEYRHTSQREEELLQHHEMLENRLTITNKSVDKHSTIEIGDASINNELLPYQSEWIAEHGNEDNSNIVSSTKFINVKNTHCTTEKNEQNDQMLTLASHAEVEDAEQMEEQQQEENICVSDNISFSNNNTNNTNNNNDNNENASVEVATARTVAHTIEPRRETINATTSATVLSTGGRNVEVHSQSTPNVQNLMELMFVNANQRLEHSLSSEHYEQEEEEEEELQELELEFEELSSEEFYREEWDEPESHSHLSHLQRPGSAHVHLSSGLGIVGPNAEDEEALRMYAEIHGKPFHANTNTSNNSNNKKASTNRIDSANCSNISKCDIYGSGSSNNSNSTSTTNSAYSSTTHSSLSATEHHAVSSVHTNM